MKVIEAISDRNIGGAGRLLLTRLAESSASDVEYTVVIPSGSMLEAKLSDIGIKYYTINGCMDNSFDISAIFEICRIIKEERADVLNAHACLSARIAALLCGVKVKIYTRHCAYPVPCLKRAFPIKQIAGGVNSILSDRIIAVAEAARENLLQMGLPQRKIEVIINGVRGFRRYSHREKSELREKLGIPLDVFIVGICARIEACKDHETFLRAARILSIKNNKYMFIIVGDGSLLEEMKTLSSALGISDRVMFTGFCENVEKYFNVFDLNVNCSVGTETSSLALSEGMSIGLPAVASAYGGNPHMVHHGENGYIYTEKDFCSLARAIEKISSSEKLYEDMSKNAYARYLEEFNSKKMTEETESLYRRLYIAKTDEVSAKA